MATYKSPYDDYDLGELIAMDKVLDDIANKLKDGMSPTVVFRNIRAMQIAMRNAEDRKLSQMREEALALSEALAKLEGCRLVD